MTSAWLPAQAHFARPRGPGVPKSIFKGGARGGSGLFAPGDDGASPPPAETEERRRGFFSRLRENMAKSRQALGAELQSSVFQTLDDQTWERPAGTLVYADAGAPPTAPGVGRHRNRAGHACAGGWESG